MAIVKTIQLDVKSNSKKAEKDFEDLKKDIDSIGESAKRNLSGKGADKLTNELNKTKQAAVSVKTRLRELEDEMANIGDVGSPQFQKLAAEAGGLRDRMNNAKAAVNSMSADFPKLQLGVQAFNAIGGAVQGAMGAAQLFGDENEELQKGMQKLVAVQSILNAVNSVANALGDETALGLKVRTVLTNLKNASDTKSLAVTTALAAKQKLLNAAQVVGATTMKLLNAAMSANPIMLIVAGVAALTGALYYFFGGTEDVTAANERLNATLSRQQDILDKQAKKIDKEAEQRRRRLKINGADEETLHKDTLRRLKAEEKQRKQQISSLSDGIAKRRRLYKKALENEQFDKAKDIREEIEADRNKYEELLLLNGDYNLAVAEENERFRKGENAQDQSDIDEAERKLKERRDKYKQYQQNRITALRQAQDLELQLNQDEIKANDLKYERLIEDTKSNENLKQKEKEDIIKSYEALRKVAEDKILADREAKEKASLQKIADFKRQAQEQALDEEAAFYEVYNQNTLTQQQLEEQAITDKYFNLIEKAKQYNLDTLELERKQAEELQAIQNKAKEEDLDAEKAKRDTQFQMANDALSAISQLVTAHAGESEKAQKKAFEINKAISMGQAIINTAQAVTGALAEPSIFPGARFVKACIAAAMGVAQIATISRTKFKSTEKKIEKPDVKAPNISQQAPTFNVVGDTGVNQLAQSLGNAPMKAYVVAGDVTSAQSLERNKIEQSTL